MAYGWFVTGFDIHPLFPNRRACMMNRYTPTIQADGGEWAESEVLGGSCLVKVRASDATLATIAAAAGFQRIPPRFTLATTLGDLTTAERNAILNRIIAMGYTAQELDAVMGSNLTQWRARTLRQLLNFICQRRLSPRFDETLRQIVLDGASVSCESPDSLDSKVS